MKYRVKLLDTKSGERVTSEAHWPFDVDELAAWWLIGHMSSTRRRRMHFSDENSEKPIILEELQLEDGTMVIEDDRETQR